MTAKQVVICNPVRTAIGTYVEVMRLQKSRSVSPPVGSSKSVKLKALMGTDKLRVHSPLAMTRPSR